MEKFVEDPLFKKLNVGKAAGAWSGSLCALQCMAPIFATLHTYTPDKGLAWTRVWPTRRTSLPSSTASASHGVRAGIATCPLLFFSFFKFFFLFIFSPPLIRRCTHRPSPCSSASNLQGSR